MGMDLPAPLLLEDNDEARRLATAGMGQKKARHLHIKHLRIHLLYVWYIAVGVPQTMNHYDTKSVIQNRHNTNNNRKGGKHHLTVYP